MSSNDDQPVATPIRYSVHVDGQPMPLLVTCDDIKEDGTYLRFYEKLIPVAIVPAGRVIAIVRREPPAEAKS